ncbi:hypothetical protein A5N15_11735 [Rothia kristinae]|uniref:Uncharacterized protein n=1 Tax=Rothia kristinae TaxID=37923 RepID=A0A657IUL0_9MICC|nr:hypothetical protein A5N15_11735 [Rothia kristinae]
MVPVASMTAVTGVVSVLPLVRDVACVPRVRIFPVAGRGGRDGVPAVGGRVCGVAVVVLMRVRSVIAASLVRALLCGGGRLRRPA